MKRMICLLIALCLMCGLLPTISVAAQPTKSAEIPDVTAYSYTVTPILSPFTYYIYVKTDNPDPTSFRLVDKTCKYYTEDSYGEIRMQNSANSYSYVMTDPGTYYISQYVYPDVAYEDESIYRVYGGYIFRADAAYSDGGEFVLLQKTRSGNTITGDKFTETEITVSCPRLYIRNDYLITHCTNEEMTFFEKLGAVQSFLSKMAVYPRSVYDSSKPIEDRSHPFLAASPYPELSLNEHYDIYQSLWGGLLAAKAYPFVLDSLGFPGTIRQIAQELEPSCTVSSASTHWGVTITFDGTSKTYGGAGSGGYDPLYTDRVKEVFTFQGDADDFGTNGTIEDFYTLLRNYEAPAAEDAEKYRDLIAGETFYKTIAETGGTWIRVAAEGFGYGTAIGYVLPLGNHVRILSDAWVDGRYVGMHETVELGAKQEDHPTASIVLHNFTFTDIRGVEHTQDVCFEYSSFNDNWNALDFYYGANIVSNTPVPDALVLTREEVEAMDLDYNTNTWPTEGLIYDGKEYPGTPFVHKSVEKVSIPETLTLHVAETQRISIAVEPADAFDTKVTLTSSDSSIVEVTNNLYGDQILGVKEGTAVITATARDGGISAQCVVTVMPAPCPGDHSYGDWIIVQEPTFESEGSFKQVCSTCYDESWGTFPVLSEKNYTVTVIEAPTCQKTGKSEYAWKQTQYGFAPFTVITDIVPHKYESVVTAPTCTEGGYTVHTCVYCKDSYTDSYTEATGHHYDITITQQPGRWNVGLFVASCAGCGKKVTEELPKLTANDYIEEEVQKPTCYQVGITSYTWKNKTYGEIVILWEIAMMEHAYALEQTVPPTCTEAGYELLVCSVCGAQTKGKTTPSYGGHAWDDGTVAKHPTCTEEGVMTYTCTRCAQTMTEPIEATGHQFASFATEPTCTEQGYTTYTCACGESYVGSFVEALGHRMGDWQIMNMPTCTEDGEKSHGCEICGYTESESLPATGHDWDNGVVTIEPTETAEGEIVFTCLRCGEMKTESIAVLGEALCDGGDGCPSNIFTDAPTPDNWAHEGIDFAIRNGLFNGMSATTFEPNTAMTRAMLVTVLWRYAGSPVEGENIFNDVENGQWYTDAIAWAAANEIVGGVGNNCFDPDGIITREQLATILYRYSNSIGIDTAAQADLTAFPDSEKVSAWAADALSWAVAEGLINGIQDGAKTYLEPLGSATRAQVATILMRYIENL